MSDVSPRFFEAKYRGASDPWDFAGSTYEQRRYNLTVALLPKARYRRMFEPGCSVGELTVRLADRTDSLLAMDCSPTAVSRARLRCAGLAHVEFVVGELPRAWPAGLFDAVVLSEIGYYFTSPALAKLIARSARALVPGGTLLAVHWRGDSTDHVLLGDEVHEVLRVEAAAQGITLIGSYVEETFRADVWTKS